MFILAALYERAIAEADKRRFAQEPGADQALNTFWLGYFDALVCAMSSFPLTCIIEYCVRI